MDERRVGFELRCATNLFKRKVASRKPPELEESTGIHGWALKYFCEHQDQDVFQKDFEAHFSIRRSTATNMLKLMETNGLILRESVPYDASSSPIAPFAASKALIFSRISTRIWLFTLRPS